MGYQKETIKGVSWIGSQRVITRSLALLKTIVLARVLAPDQFGIFGIATLVLAFLEILTETGVNVYLIQQKEKIDEYINTAWIVSIIRGVAISLVLIILSPFIASFFHSEQSKSIIILISLVPLLRGFINPSIVKFQKDLNFKYEFFRQSSIFALDTTVAIALSLITKSVSALIFGMVSGVLLEIIISYKFAKPWPKLKFDKERGLKIVNTGKWLTGAGIFQYLFQNLDNIVVGRILGTYSLGLYDMAYTFSSIPISEIADTVTKVTFPVFIKFSDDKSRLKRAFLKSTFVIILVTIPIGLSLFVFSDFILSILGKKWLPASNTLKILAIFGVTQAIFGSFSSLFLASQKQKYVTIITLVSILGLAIPIIPLVTKYNLSGAAISVVIGSFLAIPVTLFFFRKVFHEKSKYSK